MVVNTGITLYNKVTDPETRMEKLSRAYIPECLYVESQGSNIIRSGLESADKAKIYIPLSSLALSDKTGVDPKQFTSPTSQFTLVAGAIVVKGNVPDVGDSIRNLEQKYDHVHVITTVDIHDYGSNGLHHIEVGCE